jgi:hypothetical protein
MNGFIPVLIAVVLAELGPRALLYAGARRHELALWVIALLIFAAGAAGTLVGPQLTGWADALMIAIALAFAAIGQLQRIKAAAGVLRIVAAFWSGGVLLIVFAFATRFGTLATAFGALAGLVGAVVVTRLAAAGSVPIQPLRWGAAALLFGAAAIVAANALRLA